MNLSSLHADIANGRYRHGGYRSFIVSDNKKREISVASVRDRVVHRLLYEYLVPIYDQTFIFDVWSYRKEKGLLGAIERTEHFFSRYPRSFVWRADVRKFFDNVDHRILLGLLRKKVWKIDQNFFLCHSERVLESRNLPFHAGDSSAMLGMTEMGRATTLLEEVIGSYHASNREREREYGGTSKRHSDRQSDEPDFRQYLSE